MDYEENFRVSYKNEEEYIKSKKYDSHRFINGSSYDGHVYKIPMKDHDLEVFTRFSNGKYSYDVYPGIAARCEERLPDLSVYCQKIDPGIGSVNVNPANGTVCYHMESFYMNSPITARTLSLFDELVKEVFKKHYLNLYYLASGKTVYLKQPDTILRPKKNALSSDELEENISVCRDYLSGSRHNFIGETLSEDKERVFKSQVLTRDESYELIFEFLKEGIFSISAFYTGENSLIVPREYEYLVASVLNEQNSAQIVGSFRIGDFNKTGISIKLYTSMLDGVLSKETIELMEEYVINHLSDEYENIYRAVHGLPKPQENTKILEDLIEMMDTLKREKGEPDRIPYRDFEGGKELFERTASRLRKREDPYEDSDIEDTGKSEDLSMVEFEKMMAMDGIKDLEDKEKKDA